ncbi:TIGR01440 family protein [Falseniella ignava]|uniref:UPF0340 protein HMPREF9707_00350 n=1 Tax=Falseniella ignava CCUG 37419 TaxID=883112 RepID=K1LM44_9LACT|nr:TIGR01440 family protein [Falseniella ignava]EKB57890.1 TIGR01440 family protein [Falseniella ignava CCUG 37419]
MNLNELENTWREIVQDVLNQLNPQPGQGFVLGCSTSEVMGERIGKGSNADVGEMIIRVLLAALKEREMFLCVQGCEHINRSLVVERADAIQHGWEIVNVVPAMHAGGAASVAAYNQFDDPVNVEHVCVSGGIDVGDTFIGMHVQHVQVPVRPTIKELGGAHVTALRNRPKYIGGPRAQYEK